MIFLFYMSFMTLLAAIGILIAGLCQLWCGKTIEGLLVLNLCVNFLILTGILRLLSLAFL